MLVISRKGVFRDEKRIAEAPAGTELFEYDYRGGRLVVRADGETIATVEPAGRAKTAEAVQGSGR